MTSQVCRASAADSIRVNSEKHSQFASSFPIYLLSHDAPEKSFNADDELEEEEEELEAGTWVRLNDKGPIWMRYVKCKTVG